MGVVDFSSGFDGFAGRDEALAQIKRYDMPARTPMFYRTNLLLHSRRVYVLLNDISGVLASKCDGLINIDKASALALVHDDAEIITGDVQLYLKDRMSAKELEKVHADEVKAIKVLAGRWPKEIRGFNYEDLLFHALNKDCLEAQIVSYCDKIDGYCEALHEVFAGNERFKGPAGNYPKRIRSYPEKFPLLGRVIPGDGSLLCTPEETDAGTLLRNGAFHTSESVVSATGISHYDRWRELTIANFGVDVLTKVLER